MITPDQTLVAEAQSIAEAIGHAGMLETLRSYLLACDKRMIGASRLWAKELRRLIILHRHGATTSLNKNSLAGLTHRLARGGSPRPPRAFSN